MPAAAAPRLEGVTIAARAGYAQLAIVYDNGGAGPLHVLEPGSIYSVGSEPPSQEARERFGGPLRTPVEYIALTGSAIAPMQFQLGHDGENWFITRYGPTPVWLDEAELGDIQAVPIDRSGVVKVPGATITIRVIEGVRGNIGREGDLVWRRAQDELHQTALDAYRLQVGSDAAERNKTNAEMREDQRFVTLLADMAWATVSALPEPSLTAAVLSALRKVLVAKVAGASRNTAYDNVPQQFIATQLGLVAQRAAEELQLRLDPSQVNQDLEVIRRDLGTYLDRNIANIPRGDQLEIARAFLGSNIWDFIFNFGPLTDLMKLDVVSEIMVVRYDKIFMERSGVLEPYGYAFSDLKQLETLTYRISNEASRAISQTNAMVDFRLPDGSRVNVIGDPLSINGPCITIRKHRADTSWSLDQMVKLGSLSQPMAWFLQSCVLARKNIVISGGTGSGKTTLLNALSAHIQADQRVVTIEDTAELRLDHDHVVSLQGRPANVEGQHEVNIRMLVKNALRMRPDRIIVGECRGGEAVDMLQALNTGHAGSMTTAHANSPSDMLLRLEIMVLQGEPNLPSRAIRQQIATAVDIVVQVSREGGMRRVTEIAEVIGFHSGLGELIVEPIFRLIDGADPQNHRYLFTGLVPSFIEDIYRHRPMREEVQGAPVQLHEVFV